MNLASLRNAAAAAGHLVRHRRAAPGAVVLGYHDVVADGVEPGRWNVTRTQLRAQLATLERCGLRVVGLDEIARRTVAGEPLDGLAAVTFDDALDGVRTHALEVLTAAGATATVFVVSAHLGVPPPWWPGAARTLGRDALADLVDAGWTVGSHTRNHPSLPGCDPDARRRELAGSSDDLAELLGVRPRLLAYPHGHHDRAARATARDAGYEVAVTFLNGRVTAGLDPLRLPRFTMGPHLGAARLALQLARPAASWPDHQLDAVTGAPGGPGSP